MDPLASANTLATITGLVANFFSERRAGQAASFEYFKEWLASERHVEIVALLESNGATVLSVKAMLHQSHEEILKHLNDIRDKLDISGLPDGGISQSSVEDSWDDIEVIMLGEGNAFLEADGGVEGVATRCAIRVIEGRQSRFEIKLAPTVLKTVPSDPLVLPRYEASRARSAKRLGAQLTILTSQGVHNWWSYFLYGKEQWSLAFRSLIDLARLDSFIVSGKHKIDLWRTANPKLSAPMYLSHLETDILLEHLGFKSTSDLRFGPHWRSAIDLPFDLIAKHAIPRIVVQLDQTGIPAEGEVLNLLEWHIGEG